jgi:dihydrofolate reductase
MRRLAVQTFLTLDGVMQAPGAPEEDSSGRFRYGGWMAPYWDAVVASVIGGDMGHGEQLELLIGRRTYEIFAAFWPDAPPDEKPEVMNDARKHVASRTLKQVDWKNSTLVDGDVVDYVRRLKEQGGPEIQVHGSGQLIQTLLENDLVDEFRLWIFPVLLGEGKRLFGDGTIPAGLRLLESRTSRTGAIFARYERAGDISPGSFVAP